MALTSCQFLAFARLACAIAYKEWAGVCRALGEGRQTILIRKGGIAESGGVFHPEHSAFWMYPTHLHEAQQGLREGSGQALANMPSQTIPLEYLALVDSVTWVEQLDIALDLVEFHVWTEETIRQRFAYRTPGIWVLGVRVYCLSPSWNVPILPSHAGCRTWVPLDAPLDSRDMEPVLADDAAIAAKLALASSLAQSDTAR